MRLKNKILLNLTHVHQLRAKSTKLTHDILFLLENKHNEEFNHNILTYIMKYIWLQKYN